MPGCQDTSTEFHRVLVVREGKILEHRAVAGADSDDEEDEEQGEAEYASRCAQRPQRCPASGEPRPQPRRQAVSQQARSGEQEQRVPEPKVEIVRRDGVLCRVERPREPRRGAPGRHEGEKKDVAAQSCHQATGAVVQRLASGEGEGGAAPR